MSVEELEVTLCCTLDNTVVTTRLSFTEPPKEVDDIKSSIQTAFYIPQCMQQLLYNGAVLSGTEQVEKLYMRSGDSILVRYYSKLDINDFEVINTWLKKIRDIVLSYEKDDSAQLLSAAGYTNNSKLGCPHGDMADLLGKWGTPRAKVNRSYVVQEGGIDLVLKLYEIMTKIHWDELNMDSLPDLYGCLRIMWNFCETYDARLLIVHSGGFDLMVKSLSQPSVLRNINYSETRGGVVDKLVGCIANISEVECCSVKLAQNTAAVNNLFQIALCDTTRTYTCMMIAGCLFGLSFSSEGRACLMTPDNIKQILAFSEQYNDIYLIFYTEYDLTIRLIRYYLLATLSRLILLSETAFPNEFKDNALTTLKNFCEIASCSSVAEAEEKYSATWITMMPFVETMYTTKFSNTSAGKGSLEWYSSQIAVFALEAELTRDRNWALLQQQGLNDFVTCLPWICSPDWHEKLNRVVELLKRSRLYCVPKLQSITRAKLAITGGGLSSVFCPPSIELVC